MGIGPLVGTRTWGGVIGIWPRHTLVDGTETTQPEFSFWFSDVGWGVENYGTDPQIEVDNAPQDARGRQGSPARDGARHRARADRKHGHEKAGIRSATQSRTTRAAEVRLRHLTTAYAISLAALVAAVLLRWLLDPLMGDALPLVTLFGAVAVAVWVGGYGRRCSSESSATSRATTSSSSLEATFDFDQCPDVVGLAAYLFTCALIIGIGEAMRVARERASRARRAAAGDALPASATRSSPPIPRAASPT